MAGLSFDYNFKKAPIMNDTTYIDTDNAEKALGDAQAEFISAREAEDIADQALDDADTLERISDTLESRIHGATAEEVEMAQIAVEAICNRLGIAKPKPVALENYRDRITRPDATALAVEALKEIGETIWKYVLKIYRKIKEWLKKGYKYLFDGRQNLLKRARALEALVDKLEGEPKESVIKGSFIKALTFKDHFSDQNVIAATKQIAINAKLAGNLVDGLDKSEAQLKGIVDITKKAVASADDDKTRADAAERNRAYAQATGQQGVDSQIEDVLKPIVAMLEFTVKSIADNQELELLTSGKDKNKAALVPKSTPAINRMPGYVGLTEEKLQALKKLTNIKPGTTLAVLQEVETIVKGMRADFIETSDKINEDFKAKTLDTGAMSQIVSNCIDGLEEAEGYDKNIKKLTDFMQKAERLIEAAANSKSSIKNKDVSKAVKIAMRINTKFTQVQAGAFAACYRHLLDTARYSLDYVAQSAKQYKGGSMFGGGSDEDSDEE